MSALRRLDAKWASFGLLALPAVLGWVFTAAWAGKYKFKEAWELLQKSADPEVAFPWQASLSLGLPIAAVLATVIFLIGVATWRFWGVEKEASRTEAAGAPVWCPWWLVLVLCAGALATRSTLAKGSMWWDELWNVRNATVGEWKPDKTGEQSFKPTTWDRAFFNYSKPTNHAIQTVPGKLAHEAWRKLTGAAPGAFSEPVLRLPVLLSGLAAMILCARLASRWGGKSGALTAGLIFILHPWLIRYGVDARSYGISQMLVPLTILALWRATSPGGAGAMRWWWLTALGMALLMWSHALSHGLLCAGLFGAACWIIHRSHAPGVRGRLTARLVMMCAAGAGLFFVLYLPPMLQAVRWHERNDDGKRLTGEYFMETLAQVTLGTNGGTALSIGVSVLVVLSVAAGLWILWKRDARAALLMASAIGALVVFALLTRVVDQFFYHRFIIGLAGPAAVMAGVAAGWKPLRFPMLAVGALWIWQGYLQRPKADHISPMREAVQTMRAARDAATAAGAKEGLIACYGLGANLLQCYAPEVIDLRTPDSATGITELVARARAEGRPLWVSWGYDDHHTRTYSGGFALLKDQTIFAPVDAWEGVEPDAGFQTVRLILPPTPVP